MILTVNTDGASRGNPGPSSYGFVIKDKDTSVIIYEEGKTLGINTNNFAEYTAVLRAMEYILNRFKKDISHIEVIADSQLVAQQLSGNYKIKSPSLKLIFDRIKCLELELPPVFYKNVPRELNKEADRLANQALDLER